MEKLDPKLDESLPVKHAEEVSENLPPKVEVTMDADFGSMSDTDFDGFVEKMNSPDSGLETEEKITKLSKIKSELGSTIDDIDTRISKQRQSLGDARTSLNLPEQSTTDDAESTEIRGLIDSKKKAEDRLEKVDAILTDEKVKGENGDQEKLNEKKTREGLYYCSQSLGKLGTILHERAGDGFDSMIDDRGLSAIDSATRNLDQMSGDKEIDPAQLKVTINALHEGLDAFGRAEFRGSGRDSVDSLESMANALKSAHEGAEILKQSLSLSGEKYLDSVNVLKKLGDEVIPASHDFLVRKINALDEYHR